MNLETKLDESGKPYVHERTDAELEAWAMFCIMTAGKGAQQTRNNITRFLATGKNLPEQLSPFEYMRFLDKRDSLENALRISKVGEAKRFATTFRTLMKHDAAWLRTCTLDDMETMYGVGLKTSRYFMLTTRPNAQYACLDTFVLTELRSGSSYDRMKQHGLGDYIFHSTPPRSIYLLFEKVVLEIAKECELTPLQLTYQFWYKHGNIYQGRKPF